VKRQLAAIGVAASLAVGIGGAADAAPRKPAVSMSATTAHSTPRVMYEMKKPAVHRAIVKARPRLQKLAKRYGTSYAFERDIWVCERTYKPLGKPGSKLYASDPTARALSECINATIKSHKMYD